MPDPREDAAETPVGNADAAGQPESVSDLPLPEQPPMTDADGNAEPSHD